MKDKTKTFTYTVIIIYFIFLLISNLTNYRPGEEISKNFIKYFVDMAKILPFAFILIGLFEVWVDKKTVEKHLGKNAGFASYIWAIILGGSTIGPMIVALPVAYTLYKKGANLKVIFTYIGAASVCRIPMTLLEASYIGVKFTVIRYLVSIPLIIIASSILGSYLEKSKYRIPDMD